MSTKGSTIVVASPDVVLLGGVHDLAICNANIKSLGRKNVHVRRHYEVIVAHLDACVLLTCAVKGC